MVKKHKNVIAKTSELIRDRSVLYLFCMSEGVTRNFQLGTPISAFILGVGVNNIEPIWIVVDEVSFTRYTTHDGILF